MAGLSDLETRLAPHVLAAGFEASDRELAYSGPQ